MDFAKFLSNFLQTCSWKGMQQHHQLPTSQTSTSNYNQNNDGGFQKHWTRTQHMNAVGENSTEKQEVKILFFPSTTTQGKQGANLFTAAGVCAESTWASCCFAGGLKAPERVSSMVTLFTTTVVVGLSTCCSALVCLQYDSIMHIRKSTPTIPT